MFSVLGGVTDNINQSSSFIIIDVVETKIRHFFRFYIIFEWNVLKIKVPSQESEDAKPRKYRKK